MNENINGEAKGEGVTLSPEDAAALDAVMALRAQPIARLATGAADAEAAGTSVDPQRSARVQGWLNALGAAPAPRANADLLGRTLAAVENERMKLQPAANAAVSPKVSQTPPSHAHEATPRRSRSFLREIAAMLVAASLLVAVIIPAVGQARQSYRRTICATNMANLGTAFNTYSVAFNHDLPSLGNTEDGNWLYPAPAGHTNTANLMPLINVGYISPARLICAGPNLSDNATATATKNDIRNCGYSYTNLFGPAKQLWNGSPATIILADRNPLFANARITDPDTNSLNHNQKGNYLLRADGHVTWETSPIVGSAKDNIWTVGSSSNQLTRYTGTEVSTSSTDVFLSP